MPVAIFQGLETVAGLALIGQSTGQVSLITILEKFGSTVARMKFINCNLCNIITVFWRHKML